MNNLSKLAKLYIVLTIGTGAILFGYSIFHFNWLNIWMVITLSILASLSLILKVEGATERSHYNISFLVYAFTFVLLGPEATYLVVLVSNLVDWVWHKYPWYIQSFNIGNYIIAFHLAGLVTKYFGAEWPIYSLVGVARVLTAMAVFTLVNHFMVALVILLARGQNFAESGLFKLFSLMLDFVLLGMGAGIAFLWDLTPFGIVFIILPLYLIYTTLKVPALERKSETDPKTGLYNAEYFNKAFDEELERASRFNRPLTVVIGDLDLLRNINNTYGHLAGDEVLIHVANMLNKSTRDFDVVARFGGEEFAIMMPETMPDEAYTRIDRIRREIEESAIEIPTSVTPIRVTISFGIAGREKPKQTRKDIIHNADTALYHAKIQGRNGTYIYSEEGIDLLFNPVLSQPKQGVDGEEAIHATSNAPKNAPVALEAEEREFVQETKGDTAIKEKDFAAKPRSMVAVYGYVTGLAVIAITIFLSKFLGFQISDGVGLAVFIVMVILAEWFSIDIYVRNTAVSTSAVPILAGILLFGAAGALLLSFAFATVAFIKHRSPINRFVFNFSNQLIAAMLYTSVLVYAGVNYQTISTISQVIISISAMGVVFFSTTLLISIGISIESGLLVRDIWKENFSWLFVYYLSMGLIAYTLTVAYQIAGLLGMVIFFVPLMLLRLGQKQFIDRTRDYVDELKAKNLELEESSNEIQSLNEGLLNTLAGVVDLRDPYVLGHSKQVSHYAALVAAKLGLGEKRVELIRKAGLLHDIGKIGIPEHILFKPGKLTEEEYDKVKEHVVLSTSILKASHALDELIPIIHHHHERFDGKGYPDGIAGQSIPLEARILCLADAVEAMASDRPYRRGLNHEEIIDELKRNAGTQFDPMIVRSFVDVLQLNKKLVVVNSARDVVQTEGRLQPVLWTSGASD